MPKTTKLSRFTMTDHNRPVNWSHVKSLAESIKEHGQLLPIIVSQNNIIMDGQHRYYAIKAIQEEQPDFPMVYERRELSATSLAVMNGNQLKWTLNDWINFYCSQDNEHYLDLEQLHQKYPRLSMSAMAALTHKSDNVGYNTKTLRDGHYCYGFTEEHEYIFDQLSTLAKHQPKLTQKAVIVAISWLMRLPNFDSKRLFDKLSSNIHNVIPQSGSGGWLQHFVYWYNKGLRSKAKLDPNDLPNHH